MNTINDFFATIGGNIMSGLLNVEYKQLDPSNDYEKKMNLI